MSVQTPIQALNTFSTQEPEEAMEAKACFRLSEEASRVWRSLDKKEKMRIGEVVRSIILNWQTLKTLRIVGMDLSRLADAIEIISRSFDACKSQLDICKSELEGCESRANQLRHEVKQLKEKLDEAEKSIEPLKRQLETLEQSRKRDLETISKLRALLQVLCIFTVEKVEPKQLVEALARRGLLEYVGIVAKEGVEGLCKVI
jgi:chromosome segregation ATPase